MGLLHTVSDLLSWFGWYVVPFVVILSAIVFIHELGHYLVGRWCGVRIDAFSIGFGPELFARVDLHGTRWRIAALPLGGYVKFHGDANAASVDAGPLDPSVDPTRTLAAQPVLNRAAIVLAGPVANFLLAFVIFTAMFMAYGRVEHMARIGRVEPMSPAAAAGFEAGDLVKSVDGEPIGSFEDLQQATLMSTGLPMTFVVDRDGRVVDLTATPKVSEVDQGVFGKRRMGHLGLASSANPSDVKIERCAPPACAVWGASQVGFIVKATSAYIVGIFAGRKFDRPGLRTDRRGADGGRDRQDQPMGVVQPRRLVLGVGRLHEPVAGAAARRRTSGVLRVRGRPRPATEPANPGNRPENRHPAGGDAARFHHLARHSAPPSERQLTERRPS